MATIITRETGATAKGSPLTNQEVDNNFINLNTAKVEKDNAQYLDFDTAATNTAGVGKVYWNDADGTLEFGLKGGNVTLQVGQEQVVRIFNNTAGAFSDMQVIRITGASGQKLTASLAQADSEVNSASSLAVVTESISAAAEGFATTGGLVRNINTSAFSEGAPLYLSPTIAGGITAVKPEAPNHTVLVGWCVRSHASSGVIYVNIMNGFELDELHDVKITSVANGQLLKWVTANSRWENTSDLDGLTSATITNNSANPALRITQTGSGNALVVEDSASPDSTPFVIDADGRVVSGHTTTSLIQASSYQAQFMGSGVNYPLAAGYTGASATGPKFALVKNRSASWSSQTAVLSGDTLGEIDFVGSDGVNTIPGARITATVDGTPGTNDMPGRLIFSTTPDGSATPVEAFRVDSKQNIGKGGGSVIQAEFEIRGNKVVTEGTVYTGFANAAAITDATATTARAFATYINAGSGATLGNLLHYEAGQRTFVGTATNQTGYNAANSLIGAANNFGFISGIANATSATITNIERTSNVAKATCSAAPNFLVGSRVYVYISTAGYADFNGYATVTAVDATSFSYASTGTNVTTVAVSGTGFNRRNLSFNATSTAHNFFGGVVRMGAADFGLANLEAITQLNVSGTTQGASGITQIRTNADSTGPTHYMGKSRSATAGGHTIVQNGDALGTLDFRGSDGHNYIQGASIVAASDGTPGLNRMPGRLVFLTTPDGSASAQERMRIDSAGNVGIGTTAAVGRKLEVRGNATGAVNSYHVFSGASVQSDVSSFTSFSSYPSTQAAAFTLGNLVHYAAEQNTFGAGSTVTNQIGFNAHSSLTGATNNYGFYGNIPSGTGRWNFYANGTADNYFAGNTAIGNSAVPEYRLDVTATDNVTTTVALAVQNSARNHGIGIGAYSMSNRNIGGIATNIDYTFDIGGATIFRNADAERMRIDSAGNVGIGTLAAAGNKLQIGGSYSGATATRSIVIGGVIDPAVSTMNHIGTYIVPSVATGTLPTLYSNYVGQGTFTGTVTAHCGYIADNLIGATKNYGFYGNIPAGTGRWNFYAAGTAANYFAGTVTIGNSPSYNADAYGKLLVMGAQAATSSSTLALMTQDNAQGLRANLSFYSTFVGTADNSPRRVADILAGFTNAWSTEYLAFNVGVGAGGNDSRSVTTERMRIRGDGNVAIGSTGTANYSLIINKNVTGATTAADIRAQGVIQSDVTNLAIGFTYQPITAAAAFTCGNIQGFRYDGVSLGAGSAVTNQFGFIVESSTTGATNNYGFYSSIPAGTGRWSFYAANTAQNYFAANVNIGDGAAAQSTTNQDLLRIRHFNSGGVVRTQVINPTTAGGSQARYDLATGTANAYGILAVSENGSGAAQMELATGAGVSNGMFFTTVGTAPIVFRQDANERIRIGASGDIGFGVTPLASTTSKLQTNTDFLFSGTNRVLLFNTYYDGAWKYAANGYGAYIKSDDTGGGGLALAVFPNNASGAGVAATPISAIRIAPTGNVSIGTQVAAAKLDIGAADNANEGAEVKLRGATNAAVDWNFDVYQSAFRLFTTDKGAGTNWQGRLSISHDTGIMVQMGSATFVGHSIRNNSASATVTGHSYVDFQNESGVATGSIINVHGTDGSSRIDFSATPAGARNSDRRAAVFQVYGNGNALAISPNGGLGYGTGAGGTVTQVTSKGTGVTLNKPTGQITMNNAALAGGALVTFNLINSLISASDSVVVTLTGGITNPENYQVWPVAITNGSVWFAVRNISGVSLSQAVQINFAIIKGATA